MHADEKVMRPIYEVNYLRAENAPRYRLIIRYFYREVEKLRYWLYKEDVFDMMKQYDEMADYTMELCQQDLKSLVDWGNLVADQDSQNIRTVADFKNRQYRYQLSAYSVEIERMMLRLENLAVEGASLEPTLLERILKEIREANQLHIDQQEEVHGWFSALMNDFKRLQQNDQDYLKTLNSAKAEELMKTTAFLVFKDKLINYLRTFVIAMQKTGTLIALELESIPLDLVEKILQQFTAYELSIPRIDVTVDEKDIYENARGRWESLCLWFIGNHEESEMDRLNEVTNEIIRKMTRYATRIVEMQNRGSNRKEQYYHLAKIFGKCEDILEAHCLSAYVFGVADCLHLDYVEAKPTENIHDHVFDQEPLTLNFNSHSRVARQKSVREPAKDYTLEKKARQMEVRAQNEALARQIAAITKDGKIDFRHLPIIDARTRGTLLGWLAKGLEENNEISYTNDGRSFHINQTYMDDICEVLCEDGTLTMPGFQIVFNEEESH